ncbi:MAG: DEAD/DEAH box helicase [Pirellulaceae bacterium]|nr:DEAD/DEAH box helicase [Pirellulaceae bacterium]
MQTLIELPKRAQVAFLLQIVEQADKLTKQYANLMRFCYRAEVQEPHVLFDGKTLEWQFVFAEESYSSYNDDEDDLDLGQLSIFMDFDPKWLETSLSDADLLSNCFSGWRRTCTCGYANRPGSPCLHFASALQLLQRRLSRLSAATAFDWMRERWRDHTTIGDELVNELEWSIRGHATATQEEHRLQWRISDAEHPYARRNILDVKPALQKLSAKGKWSAGREVRDFENVRTSVADLHPHDELIGSMIEVQSDQDHRSGSILLQTLKLLKDRPLVVWNREGFPKVEFVETQPTVLLLDDEGKYHVEIKVEGNPFKLANDFRVLNKKTHLGWIAEPTSNRLLYFQIPTDLLHSVLRLQAGQERGAKFTQEAAMRVSTVLGREQFRNSLRTVLPESLAGPEVPLLPKIQLHLLPRQPEGLIAQLRVACDAVMESPIPGIEPDRLQVATPAGPVQLIRNLKAESQAAEAYTNALGLAAYPYDGPYTWIAEDIPAALALIERAQQQAEHGLEVCWPKSQPMKLLGEITPQQLRVRVTSQRDWFGMEGELKIDGLEIPLAELLAALRRGGRYIQLATGQFAAISDQLRKRLTMMDDISAPEGKQLRVERAGATLLNDSLGDDISIESDVKWQTAIERLTSTKGLPTKPPKGLKAELRDYQVAGYHWLAKLSHWGLGGCLADDMGLGKTVQALGVLLDRAKVGPTLIVAPTSVCTNWIRETEKFAPSLCPKLYRDHDRDELIRDAGKGDLIITSYQLLQRDTARFSSRSWGTLVLDESQYIKNFATKTNQSVRNIEADWCLAISGTPLENHLGELWSLMRLISPGLLGSWERFRKRFAEGIERDRDQERMNALSRMVRPFILRRTKSEVLTELPPRTEVVLTVELSPAERKKYDAARLAALADLTAPKDGDNDQKKRIRVLTWLMRLRQLACHVRLVDDKWTKSSAKLDQFLEVIEELRENGHRALVFSQFVQHLALVRAALDKAKVPYQYLDGSTPPGKRQEAVDAFQRGEGDLFLISLKAGGTGLNLTAADYVLHLDPWWNPAVEDQATDRAHRIGQTRSVTVYRLVTRDTIEEQILALHDSKRELMSNLLEGTDSAGKMSTEELVNLIRANQILESVE